MKGKLSGNIRFLIISLLVIAGNCSSLLSQVHISGTINQYGKVEVIGADNVMLSSVAEASQFLTGDTVLLIQMKGVRIYSAEQASYGSSGFSYGIAGQHEFLTVQSVNALAKTIVFKNNIANAGIDILGDVQLVKVRSYNYAVVDPAGLTCAYWDSTAGVGGVLAAVIKRKLTLNGNVDVTGRGFKGGITASGLGTCIITDETRLNRYKYSALSDSSGFKGEGLSTLADPSAGNTPPFYPVYPLYSKGYGKNFNGGGGGNGKYSGGGGGSNYGSGGRGGYELNTCAPPKLGGWGGIQISGTGVDGGIFLGGGGGTGTYTAGGTATPGARGGGIIIMVCDTLNGNGKNILANGAVPSGNASGSAGAGGGGGGGSIALYLQSCVNNTGTLTISSSGGNGGSTSNIYGEGGGGGGGFINTSNITFPGSVTKLVSSGSGGVRSGGTTSGTNGASGKNITTFVPVLNGFLFNSIISSANGSVIDSICSNVTPKKIAGTNPVGGSGNFTYQWLKSLTGSAPWSVIAGANLKDYTPSAPEAATFWIRRYVLDNITTLKDTSKAVKIVVQPAIAGNNIGNDTTICYGQNPLKLRSIGTPAGGYGNLHYHWLQNTTNNWSAYSSAVGTDSTKANFDPASLTVTTYYKRKINAGHCVDYSATTIKITVLTSITNNVFNSHDTIICEGFKFDSLRLKKPENGSGAYLYKWQDSKPLGTWADIAGATAKAHSPDTSKFNDTDTVRYYRRIVYSGLNNTCVDTSLQVKLTRFPWITNNKIISPDTTICSGKVPYIRKGTTLTGGNGIPQWKWEQSTNSGASWGNASGSYTSQNYSPPALTAETWYRRFVKSSACVNTSSVKKVFIDPVITSFTIAPDTTICSNTAVFKIRGKSPGGGTGTYAFSWKKSTDNISYPVIGGASLKDYTPAAAHTLTTWYRRIVSSGACRDSSQVKLEVLSVIGGNTIVPDKPEVCFNSVPGPLVQTGAGLTGGSGAGSYTYLWQDSITPGTWQPSAGTNTNATYTPVNQLSGTKWFRRKVISGPAGCCISFSAAVQIDTITLPKGDIPPVSNADTTICSSGDAKIRLKLTGYKPWKVTYDGDATGIVITGINDPDYLITRKPAVTAAFSSFLFKFASVEDKNGCLATVRTGSRKVDVYRVPNTNAGSDDEICGPAYKLAAVPSDGTGAWTWEPAAQVVAPFPAAFNSKVYIDSSFNGPYKRYKFYWSELNGICPKKDSVYITFHNRIDTISAGTGASLMTFDNILKLDAYAKLPFEKGRWSVIAGSGTFENDTLNSTYVRDIAMGSNTYKWTLTNGKCLLESLVSFNISEVIIPEGISPNGDGINDSLKISGLDTLNQEIELIILNSAGAQIFTTSNKNGRHLKIWDGKSSKGAELPEGTYYYLLKVFSKKTEFVKPKTGFIILKRN